jgi:hypothetical protein
VEPWEVALTAELANGAETEAEPVEAEPVEAEPEPEALVVDAEPEPVTAELSTEAVTPKHRGVQFEPMDLTSLEMVPPRPPSRRQRQRKEG